MRDESVRVERFYIPNHDGWELLVKRTWFESQLVRRYKPVVIVPGYGMNAFIFGYHPNGPSMEESIAQRGFEVWSVNFRAQDGSRSVGGEKEYNLKDLALTDLGAVFDHIRAHTRTERESVDAIGCSLGGTLLYIHAALVRQTPLASMIRPKAKTQRSGNRV